METRKTRVRDVPADELPPVDTAPADPPAPPTVEHETMIGASVLWRTPIRGKVLVQVNDRYGLVNTDQLTGEYQTLVNLATLETPASFPGAIKIEALAWRAGIVTPEDRADKQRLQEFYRLVLAEAGKLIAKE